MITFFSKYDLLNNDINSMNGKNQPTSRQTHPHSQSTLNYFIMLELVKRPDSSHKVVYVF